jgi:hypothetical protein
VVRVCSSGDDIRRSASSDRTGHVCVVEPRALAIQDGSLSGSRTTIGSSSTQFSWQQRHMDRGMVPSLLDVHIGSPLHEVCDAPLRRDQIVVAPSLFGSARNVTTFHDLRDEVQEAIRAEEDDVTWSYESRVASDGVFAARVHRLPDKSPAFLAVRRRVCQYFSIDGAACRAGIALHRGRPECQYRSAPKYVRRCACACLCFCEEGELVAPPSPRRRSVHCPRLIFFTDTCAGCIQLRPT